MIRYLNRVAIALVMFAIVAPNSALAGKKHGGRIVVGAAKGEHRPNPQGMVLTSVNGNMITVTEGKASKTVTVPTTAEITINEQRGKITDLKPAMWIDLDLTSPTEASRITAATKSK